MLNNNNLLNITILTLILFSTHFQFLRSRLNLITTNNDKLSTQITIFDI